MIIDTVDGKSRTSKSKSLSFPQGFQLARSRSAQCRCSDSYRLVVSPRYVRSKEALCDWLRKEHGQDLLSENNASQLLTYARSLFALMKQEGVRPGEQEDLRTASGRALSFEWKRDMGSRERSLQEMVGPHPAHDNFYRVHRQTSPLCTGTPVGSTNCCHYVVTIVVTIDVGRAFSSPFAHEVFRRKESSRPPAHA